MVLRSLGLKAQRVKAPGTYRAWGLHRRKPNKTASRAELRAVHADLGLSGSLEGALNCKGG